MFSADLCSKTRYSSQCPIRTPCKLWIPKFESFKLFGFFSSLQHIYNYVRHFNLNIKIQCIDLKLQIGPLSPISIHQMGQHIFRYDQWLSKCGNGVNFIFSSLVLFCERNTNRCLTKRQLYETNHGELSVIMPANISTEQHRTEQTMIFIST